MNNEEIKHKPSGGRIFAGLILIGAGTVFLMRQLGYYMPDWLISWPMLLVAVGLYIGAQHQFRRSGWFIVTFIGLVFLADRYFFDIEISKFIWPMAIIAAGVYMLFTRRKKKWDKHDWMNDANCNRGVRTDVVGEDVLETVVVLGGIRKQVNSKDFKGGEITCVFSGVEVDLSQAEINGKVSLEINTIFGGTKLLVPPHWEIKSEIVAVMGGMEDKRPMQGSKENAENVLIIKGSCILGGIEIKSY